MCLSGKERNRLENRMRFDRTEWIGNWENFELYFTDTDPAMCKAWEDAETATKNRKKDIVSAFLFRHGAKQFWMDGCYTITKENPIRLGGCHVSPVNEEDMSVEWLDENQKSLGTFTYALDMVLEKGLEDKENYLLYAKEAPENCPFRYLLSMPPMPEHSEKLKGGLISHLHFQFASTREQMIKENGKLKKPHWYATMCDADATMQQRCNIVRALHKLEIDTEVR